LQVCWTYSKNLDYCHFEPDFTGEKSKLSMLYYNIFKLYSLLDTSL